MLGLGNNLLFNAGAKGSAGWANVYSVLFDGVDDRARITGYSDPGGDRYYSFWFKGSVQSGNGIFSTGIATQFGVNMNWGGSTTLLVFLGGGFQSFVGQITNPDTSAIENVVNGTWRHIVLSVDASDASQLRCWVDGQSLSVASTAAANPVTFGNTLTFGNDGGSRYFNGNVDEFSWFSGLADQSLVDELWNSGFPGDPASTSGSLQAYWRMGDDDGGTGTVVSDGLGDTSLNMSLNNGATIVADAKV